MESKLFLPSSCILFLVASFMLPAVLSHRHNTNPSPLRFLKGIQGCHKGETLKGIRDLKLYLAHLGYLNYQKNPNVTRHEQDHFGEELEEALKSYQAFYHLNATGVLDRSTVSEMSIPRCGCPDKDIHKNTVNSLNNDTVSLYSFFPGRLKWPSNKRHLTYAFGPRYPTKFMPPVDRAFRRWSTAFPYFTFSRARSYQSADLTISFQGGNHGDGYPFDGRGGTLAHAFAPTNGRFHFDAAEAWAVGAVPNAHDVETTALHEIGHLLGLAHSNVQDAIMYPEIRSGVTKGLNSDDIQGLSDLYGSSEVDIGTGNQRWCESGWWKREWLRRWYRSGGDGAEVLQMRWSRR
ncbi:hypothetical protein LXL04_023072 [Taraxacum kok-saghyz]